MHFLKIGFQTLTLESDKLFLRLLSEGVRVGGCGKLSLNNEPPWQKRGRDINANGNKSSDKHPSDSAGPEKYIKCR